MKAHDCLGNDAIVYALPLGRDTKHKQKHPTIPRIDETFSVV